MIPLDLSNLLNNFASLIETILLWIAWGSICACILPQLYSSKRSYELVNRLRRTTILIHVALIFLLFLPWFPRPIGYANGIDLVFGGNGDVTRYFIILVISFLLLLTPKNSRLWKVAVLFHIFNSILILTIITSLQAGIAPFTIHDIAPVLSALLLWLGNGSGLLLWNRLIKTDAESIPI